MNRVVPAAELFYRQHPISEEQVLDALRRQGKDLGKLSPEDLYEWDQDHYGGLAAVEALTRRAGISADSHVLDVCAGLAGPARYIAARHAARVTCVDLSPERAAGAQRLTTLVGLGRLVRVVRADAQALPFPRSAFTAVISQEGLLHVPDKARVLDECARVLRPGGRLAFSDWVATPRLSLSERRRLEEWMGVLRRRLEMFQGLRAQTVARLGPRRYEEYNQLYAFFVGLVESRKLGGARFSAGAGPGIS